LIAKVLAPVEYCHERNVVHRDLKPSNIMCRSSDDLPILVDFGLAYSFENLARDQERYSTHAMGSHGYMAPEVIQNFLHVDRRNDLYALGVTLYQLIAGRLPNPKRIEHLTGMDKGADAELDRIIMRALDHQAARYQTARELSDVLSHWASQA